MIKRTIPCFLTALATAMPFGCSNGGGTQSAGPVGDFPLEQLSVNHMSDLPACVPARQGEVAYVRETKSLVACLDRHWTGIALPAGPSGPRGDAGPAGPAGPEGPAGP